MCATTRSEGFRVSKLQSTNIFRGIFSLAAGLAACCLLTAGPAAASTRTDDRQQARVYTSVFALPPSLPAGMHASLVIYNTTSAIANVKLRSVRAFPGEAAEARLQAGASLRLAPAWMVPGLPILLECNVPQTEVQLQVKNGLDVLLESFPIQVAAKTKHDYVLPIAGGNSACPGANPAAAAAATTLTLVPATVQSGGSYDLTGYDADGSVVGTASVGALMGLAVGVDLAEEFDSEELEDIRTVRVESEYGFGGYGVAAVGSDDALGIQPDTRSTWWQTMPPDDWDVVEPISHLIVFNPQSTAVDVVVDGGSPIELAAHSTTEVAFPGAEVEITAEAPIVVVEAYAQADGCGVTAQMSCSNNRPWSIPVLLDSTDVLVASGPRLGY